jgi:biopolymer transport protein ExbD
MNKKITIIIIIVLVIFFVFFIIQKREIDINLQKIEIQKSQTSKKNEESVLMPGEKEIIKNEYKQIDTYVRSLKTIEQVKDALPTLNNYSSVKRAYVEGTNLFIDFKNGGTFSWLLWGGDNIN